jgi:hypothetical protein
MAVAARVFWWATAIAVAAGWCLALEACLFLLLAPLPERDWRSVELSVWGLAIVAMTLASIISALSLIRLSQKRRSEWFSRRIQLWALTTISLVQLVVFVVPGVEPMLDSDPGPGPIPLSMALFGAFQLAGLTAGINAVRATPP